MLFSLRECSGSVARRRLKSVEAELVRVDICTTRALPGLLGSHLVEKPSRLQSASNSGGACCSLCGEVVGGGECGRMDPERWTEGSCLFSAVLRPENRRGNETYRESVDRCEAT